MIFYDTYNNQVFIDFNNAFFLLMPQAQDGYYHPRQTVNRTSDWGKSTVYPL